VSRLAGLLRGRDIPALLVAAGPSLDDIADCLGGFAERCMVIAVDTSLNFLLRAGVDPDWIVSGDPQYWNARHLDRLDRSAARLVTESAIYPSTMRRGSGVFLFATTVPARRQAEDAVDPKGALGSGGSVATTALDFCLSLSPSAVYIAGLDLAFPNNKTHFKDAFFEKQANAQATRLNPAETRSFRALRDGGAFPAKSADGGAVLTDKRLSLYAAWFENRLAALTPPEKPPVYSLSGKGLSINGILPAAPRDIARLPVRRPVVNALLRTTVADIEADFARGYAERRAKQEQALTD
jgi:hypothetical protein